MNVQELAKICDNLNNLGVSRVSLTMPIPKSGVTGYRCRTPFGLCEILTVNENMGVVVFSVEVKKIEKWIERAIK